MTGAKKSDKFITNESSILMLMILFLAGVFAGTVLYCNFDITGQDKLLGIAGSFIDTRLEQTFIQTLVNSFSGAFMLLLGCFILGFCAISQPIEVLIPVFRGLGLGVSLAGMYSQFGLGGFCVSLVLIVPQGIVSAIVIMFAAREAVRMSNSIGMVVFSGRHEFEAIDNRLYFTKFVILSAVLVASSIIDSLLTFVFAGFWTSILGI